MPRGKKKGGKQEDQKELDQAQCLNAAMSTLSVGSEGPSTSAVPDAGGDRDSSSRQGSKESSGAPEKTEDDFGLAIVSEGGGRKRKPRPKKPKAAPAAVPEGAPVIAPAATLVETPITVHQQGYPGQPGPPQGYSGQPGPRHDHPRQPFPEQGHPGPPQGYPGQPGPQQGHPGQPFLAQGHPGQLGPQQGYPGQHGNPQGYPGQPGPPQGYPGQPGPPLGFPAQPGPGQANPGQPGPPQGYPGQSGPRQAYPGQPGQPQPYPGQPGPPQGYPGQSGPRQAYPGQPGQSQAYPGQPGPRQGHPEHPGAPQGHPGQPGLLQGQPGPLQGQPGQPGPPQGYPGQSGPRQAYPGQPGQPQAYPGQPGPRQGHPEHPRAPQGHPGQPGLLQGQPGPLQGQPGQPGPLQGQPGPPQGHPSHSTIPGQTQQQASKPAMEKPKASQADKTIAQLPKKAGSPSHDPTKCRFQIPKKIQGGKVQARDQMLLTNYLEMRIKPNMKIYRYDVGFTPDRPKKAIPEAFKKAMKKHFPNIIVAFDQMKNFYSVEPLPKVTTTDRLTDQVELIDDNGKTMKFEVSFKATGTIEMNSLIQYMQTGGTSLNPPTEAIQCVDVILRQGTLESYVKAGRTFFKRPGKPIELGDGLEMWTGLFQSAIFTSRPYVNIDVAHKGFPIAQPMVALLQSLRLDPNRDLRQQRGRGIETLKQFIKTLRVVALVAGDRTQRGQRRQFICNDLAAPPGEIKFDCKDASGRVRKMTVAEYFVKEKGCRLQYPNLNCMWVGPRDKNIYYPMELLEIAYGQVRNRQLNDQQLRIMVTEAATPPNVRKQKIEDVIKDMNYSSNPHFKKFGLEISNNFAKVPGRVMPPPRLQCGGNFTADPRKGAWVAEKLLQGAALSGWGLVGVGVDAGGCKAQNIISMFQSVGQQMGMSVAAPTMTKYNLQLHELHATMQAAVAARLQLLVVVVTSDPRVKDAYSQVKKVAELNVGLLTQCIKDKTAAMRMNPQTVRNILLKVNSKLMGTNQAIHASSLPACLREPFMLVGADVTHPSPDQVNIPSIAAVTASIDKKGFKYNLELSIQAPKMEMIVQFEEMMVDHLTLFKQQLNILPRKIYVFRDGVSEGQFAQVMESELQAVYNAHARLSGGGPPPQVLFMLVQKRHHTRFFLDRSSNNVEPGTVVDKEIVHPSELDFYLVSHQAIKGTARPTRYHAVCNDSALPADEAEQLAFYLCHLYSRCTRSVSYPAPTYYAHLACLRARALTLGNVYNNADLEKTPRRLHIKDEVKRNNPMFFV